MAGLAPTAAHLSRWTFGHALPAMAFRSRANAGDLQGQVIQRTNRSPELPNDLFDQIREAGPFYEGKFALATARHAVVRETLASNDVAAGRITGDLGRLAGVAAWGEATAPTGPLNRPSLLATDPPDHTRMRKLVTRVFSARAVEQLRSRTEEISAGLLDDIERRTRAGERVDLIDAFAAPLPVTVICEILGVAPEDQEVVREFGNHAAPSLDFGLPLRRFRQVERALRGFEDWLEDHVEQVRRQPGDDLFSQLVAARDDDGGRLDDRELRSTAGLVLAAGFETTVNLIGNATALLADHPDQRAALVAGDVPWSGAVDESLRYDPPVLLTARTTTRETEIAGQQIRARQPIVTLLAGANRDPEVFADPHRFDVRRENADDHVSFSSGRHYCLGAALARMEGEVALRSLHERFPQLRPVAGARRRETRILRGFATLPISV